MRRLEEVEEARNLMLEAKDWGVWKWLTEKSRMRAAADRANEALDKLDERVKSTWSDELRRAYSDLEDADQTTGRRRHPKGREAALNISAETRSLAKKLKQADDEAWQAHIRAEQTFADAEAKLSTSMAKEGTLQAIESWDLKEKAIKKSEAAASH